LMEALQAFTYLVINDCSSSLNQVLTFLGYLHICFQPFFLHMVSMYFIPEQVRSKITKFVFLGFSLTSFLLLLLLYPFCWASACDIQREPLCSSILCSVSGNWHIAWELPLNGLPWSIIIYFIGCFLVPLVYGSWKLTLSHFFFGPTMAYILSSNKNEWPAVWCLMSIALICICFKTPLRKHFAVKHWPVWKVLKLA